jgi:hypothetical protein
MCLKPGKKMGGLQATQSEIPRGRKYGPLQIFPGLFGLQEIKKKAKARKMFLKSEASYATSANIIYPVVAG